MLNATFRPSFHQQDHVELLEKLDLLQSKMIQEVGVSQPNSIQKQLQDDVGICLLKLGRLVIVLHFTTSSVPVSHCQFKSWLAVVA
jgi:hypothetical protein